MLWLELITQLLPIIITAIMGGGGIAAGFPLIKRLLAKFDNQNAMAANQVETSALSDVFAFGKHVVDFIKAKGTSGNSDKGLADGVKFLKGLFDERFKALKMDDSQIERVVQAMIAAHG